MSIALALAPNGRLFIEDSGEAAAILDSDAAERICRAFSAGNPSGRSVPWSTSASASATPGKWAGMRCLIFP